jgi:RND family efflux transporter MFP subunit
VLGPLPLRRRVTTPKLSCPVYALPIASLLVLVAACGREAPSAVPVSAVPQLATVEVVLRPAPRERVWDGVVEAVNQATVSAQTAGRVIELPFDVDDKVPAGAVIVRFTDVEQQAALRQAQAQLRAATAAADEAEADYTRTQNIYERKLVARAQYDQAVARRDSARAALQAANAAVRAAAQQLDYTVVRAPYAGVVTRRYVEVGESVRPGQLLISGIGIGAKRVNVVVPQSDVDAIRLHHSAAVLLDPDGTRRIAATEVTVFPYADPQTHSFQVRLALPEEGATLNPGTTVKVAFLVGTEPRLLVPASAVVQRSEVTAVYVLQTDGVVLRQVRLGHRHGDQLEVHAGLREGERVVADAAAAIAWLARSAAPASDR